jgi:hypothetical protein
MVMKMDDSFRMMLAVKLCSADMSCGYISVDPVLGNRNEQITQRLKWYSEKLLVLTDIQIADPDIKNVFIEQAVSLTCADIICDVIAIAPVLYDRNEKIFEKLKMYMSLLLASFPLACADDQEECIADMEKVEVREKATPKTSRSGGKRRKRR